MKVNIGSISIFIIILLCSFSLGATLIVNEGIALGLLTVLTEHIPKRYPQER